MKLWADILPSLGAQLVPCLCHCLLWRWIPRHSLHVPHHVGFVLLSHLVLLGYSGRCTFQRRQGMLPCRHSLAGEDLRVMTPTMVIQDVLLPLRADSSVQRSDLQAWVSQFSMSAKQCGARLPVMFDMLLLDCALDQVRPPLPYSPNTP